jgi:hypothetical protein
MTTPRLPSDLGELLDLHDAVRAELKKRRGRGKRACSDRAPRCMGQAARGYCTCWDGVPLPTIDELRERAGRQPITLRISYPPERLAEALAAVDRAVAGLAEAGLLLLVEVDRGQDR